MSNVEIFSAFPSDSFQFLSYSYHDKLLVQSVTLFIQADKEALCFQAEDYSVHLKMDFKAVPIQLTVDLCQPSVLPTQSDPSLTGHYGMYMGRQEGKVLKKPGISERPFLHRIGSTAHLKLRLTTNYWNDRKSGNLPIVLPFFHTTEPTHTASNGIQLGNHTFKILFSKNKSLIFNCRYFFFLLSHLFTNKKIQCIKKY